MENIYVQSSRLLGDTQRLLQQLLTAPENVHEAQIRENLEQLEQDVFRLQTMSRKEIPSQRQEAYTKVEQLNSDLQSVQRMYQNYQRRIAEAEREAEQREELLMRRYTPNTATAGGSAQTSIPMDHSVEHRQSLSEANSNLRSILSHGNHVMHSLRTQHFTLKGAHRKLLDLTSTLGLSNTVMRFIEKRTEQDWWVFWSGILITSTIIFLLIYYFIL